MTVLFVFIGLLRLWHPSICVTIFFFIQVGLNLSSSQPSNLTIQSFVQSYVDKYIGGFTV